MDAKLDVSKVVGEVTILPVKTCNLPCYEKAAPNDRFRIDRQIKRHATRCNRHALESDGRASTSPIGKRRAFDDEVRPVRRGRCAFLITFPGQRDWIMEVTRVRITDDTMMPARSILLPLRHYAPHLSPVNSAPHCPSSRDAHLGSARALVGEFPPDITYMPEPMAAAVCMNRRAT